MSRFRCEPSVSVLLGRNIRLLTAAFSIFPCCILYKFEVNRENQPWNVFEHLDHKVLLLLPVLGGVFPNWPSLVSMELWPCPFRLDDHALNLSASFNPRIAMKIVGWLGCRMKRNKLRDLDCCCFFFFIHARPSLTRSAVVLDFLRLNCYHDIRCGQITWVNIGEGKSCGKSKSLIETSTSSLLSRVWLQNSVTMAETVSKQTCKDKDGRRIVNLCLGKTIVQPNAPPGEKKTNDELNFIWMKLNRSEVNVHMCASSGNLIEAGFGECLQRDRDTSCGNNCLRSTSARPLFADSRTSPGLLTSCARLALHARSSSCHKTQRLTRKAGFQDEALFHLEHNFRASFGLSFPCGNSSDLHKKQNKTDVSEFYSRHVSMPPCRWKIEATRLQFCSDLSANKQTNKNMITLLTRIVPCSQVVPWQQEKWGHDTWVPPPGLTSDADQWQILSNLNFTWSFSLRKDLSVFAIV